MRTEAVLIAADLAHTNGVGRCDISYCTAFGLSLCTIGHLLLGYCITSVCTPLEGCQSFLGTGCNELSFLLGKGSE